LLKKQNFYKIKNIFILNKFKLVHIHIMR